MKRSTYVVLTAAVTLFLTQTVWAQNTLSYATADYDEETNTVYGYAYTNPDYSAGVYYNQTYVGASISDANDNFIDTDNKTAYGRSEVFLEGPGTGNPPYKISSGHYLFMSYYVSNYYDPYSFQYRSGYLDYYYYTYFSEGPGGPVINVPLTFTFTGRRPETVTPSINRFLGTLLSSLFPLQGDVSFRTAVVGQATAEFSRLVISEATIRAADTGRQTEICGTVDQRRWFKLTVNFQLPFDGTLAANRCTVRPVAGRDEQDYVIDQSSVLCVMDSSDGRLGHLDVLLLRRMSGPDEKPKVSVGIGCNLGTGVCDSKGNVKISCS